MPKLVISYWLLVIGKKSQNSEPKTQNSKGFTLIELLVVISIIAVLAVIGVTVFSGAQANARDGRRRSDITSIAKSIETAKDPTGSVYKYESAVATKDFPRGIPQDPDGTIKYCIDVDTATAPPAAHGATWTATACPAATGYNQFATDSTTISAIVGADNDIIDGTIKSWTLCANLERGTPFCVKSLTQ